MLRQQVGALVHDEHAGGVELQALLVLPGVEVEGRVGGKIEHGLILHGPLGGDVDHAQGVLPVAVLLLIKVVVLLGLDLALGALPQGHHGVEGLPLPHGLVFRLVVLPCVRGAGLFVGVLHLHFNGIVDIVGVLLDQTLQRVRLQILGIVLLVGVGLELHDDLGAHVGLFAARQGVPVRAGGLPAPRLAAAPGPGGDGDGVGHHKGGVEAHAELADDVGVALGDALGLGHVLLELEGAAFGDGTQVLLQFLLRHAHAVVADGEGARGLVGDEGDLKRAPVQRRAALGQGLVGQLVDGVAGVGDDLTEEDLLVGVDGVDHQIQQTLGLRLELLLCHVDASYMNSFVIT